MSDGYQFVRTIGHGSMTRVSEYLDTKLQRPVAVKQLLEGLAEESAVAEAFVAEAGRRAQISHRNVLPIFQVEVGEGGPRIIEEYADKGSLADLIQSGPLGQAALQQLLEESLAGLAEIHSAGLVHGAISPENVLVCRNVFKLSDFALDLSVRPKGTLRMRTPRFLAPEARTAGRRGDARSDLYALGMTVYAAGLGEQAFRDAATVAAGAASAAEAARLGPELWSRAHASEAAWPEPFQARPEFPPEVWRVVRTMIAKRPEERPRSAREVLTSGPSAGVDPAGGARPTGPLRPRRHGGGAGRILRLLALWLVVLLLLVVAVVRLRGAAPVKVSINSTPVAAEVRLGADRLGSTPFERDVPSGSQLRIEAEGYEPVELEVAAAMAKTVTLTPRSFRVAIESRPPGATIRVGERELGVAPIPSAEVRTGDRISFSLSGYLAENVDVIWGQARVEATLRSLGPRELLLALSTNAGGLRVALNGLSGALVSVAVGDLVTVEVANGGKDPCQLGLFVLTRDQKVEKLLPRTGAPAATVQAGGLRVFPEASDGINLVVKPPAGRELLVAVCSKAELVLPTREPGVFAAAVGEAQALGSASVAALEIEIGQ